MSDKPAVDKKIIIEEEQAQPVTREDKEKQRAARDYSQDSRAGQRLTIKAKVYSPFRDYFDGPAISLSAKNATGPFDILPKHHNFISLLSPGEIVIQTVKGEKRTIIISGGLLHVKANQVLVFLDV